MEQTELSDLNSAIHGRQRRQERQIEKIDLQRAKRYGMKEYAKHGRIKYTYGGIVFIYDPVRNREVTSYVSSDISPSTSASTSTSPSTSTSGTKVAKPIILSKKKEYEESESSPSSSSPSSELSSISSSISISLKLREINKTLITKQHHLWSSHSVLVVDMSGSMRRDDVNGARCRSDGVWMSLARDYISKPLQNKTRSDKDLISIIVMKEKAHLLFDCEPTDWYLYNKLIDMREWILLRPSGPGNYLPALSLAEMLLMKNKKGNCALSLLFFSDGRPSDKGGSTAANIDISERMGEIASKFGRRLSVACIGMAEEGEDFSTLNNMVQEAKSFGSVASFGKPTLDADSLSNIISSLASSLTTSMTEMTNVETGKLRQVRMDVRREKVNTPDGIYLNDEWTSYSGNVSRRNVTSIWSWDYKLNDFVQLIDPRCTLCWEETNVLDDEMKMKMKKRPYGIVCQVCQAHVFCPYCMTEQPDMNRCLPYLKRMKRGEMIRKPVPSFNVAVKKNIFGEGAERIVHKFRFLDPYGNLNRFIGPVMVAKESRFLETTSKSATTTTTRSSLYADRMDYHREFMRTQAIAAEYAKKFNHALEDIYSNFEETDHYFISTKMKLIPRIEFLEPLVVQTHDPSKEVGEYNILVEEFLDGKYEKFNDNMGMVRGQSKSVKFEDLVSSSEDCKSESNNNMYEEDLSNMFSGMALGLGAIVEEGSEGEGDGEEDEDEEGGEEIIEAKHSKPSKNGSYNFSAIKNEYIPQAFSHFTYENSKKNFLVVDLQGILKINSDGSSCYRLTDPVIHKQRKKKKKKLRQWSFGRTDRGEKGMEAFFHTHQCNDLCRLLGLEEHH